MSRSKGKYCISIVIVFMFVLDCLAYSSLPTIHYQKYVFPNGLTLIVVRNHHEPIVAVSMWYHVGSKDDVSAGSGLAHFVEHIMCEGSEHHKANFISAMQQVGATGINAVTNRDRTAYFETVPLSALDYTLWLEADRMAHLLGAVDENKVAAQIQIIDNEQRQGEAGSSALTRQLIAENTYPPGHPYRRSTIGEISALRAASLSDINKWLQEYYGASNAVLVLAGDVDPEIARQKVQRYFGDIGPGAPRAVVPEWIAKMSGNRLQIVHGHMPQQRIYKVWNVPGFGTTDGSLLDLFSDCLNDEFRRLDRAAGENRVRQEHPLDARASVQLGELGGQFRIEATVAAGDSVDEVDRKMNGVLAQFLQDGPKLSQLDRIKKQYATSYVMGLDMLSGAGSAAEKLAQGQLFRADPDVYWKGLQSSLNVTPIEMRSAARRWLADGCYSLELIPDGPDSQDRSSSPPTVEPFPGPKLPTLQRTQLTNGVQVILVERHDLPIIDLTLVLGVGYAADPPGLPGTACLTTAMLDSSSVMRSGSDQLADLGTSLQVDCNFEISTVRVSTLTRQVSRAINILAESTIHPSFSREELEQKRKQELASRQSEARTPLFVALYALPPLLYDPEFAWPNPFIRGGTAQDLGRITLSDVRKFHRDWFRPSNATLLVVGDTTMESLRPQLDKSFKQWPPGAVPGRPANRTRESPAHGIYFVDRPGATQSFILAGALGLRKSDPADLAAELVNDTLDGTLGSRLNMILREEKHWSYGVSSHFYDTKQRQPLVIYTSVQSDKTADAIAEMKKEFAAISASRPVVNDELNGSKANRLLDLAASFETVNSTTQSLINVVANELPDDYLRMLPERIVRLTTAELQDAAKRLIEPEDVIWIIVGDRASVEPELKHAALGELHSLNLGPRN